MRQCSARRLFEYSYTFPQGITPVATLVALVEDPRSSLPESVRIILELLVDTFTALEAQIAALDAEINRRSKADPTARRLMTIPGVGANCLDGNYGVGAGRGRVSGGPRLACRHSRHRDRISHFRGIK